MPLICVVERNVRHSRGRMLLGGVAPLRVRFSGGSEESQQSVLETDAKQRDRRCCNGLEADCGNGPQEHLPSDNDE